MSSAVEPVSGAMEPRTEQWTFGGSRVSAKGQRVHAWWAPEDNDELWYPAKGTYAIGGVYEAKVSRGGGRIIKHGPPIFIGRSDDADLREQLEARHRAAQADLARVTAERKVKSMSGFDDRIDELARLVNQVAYGQRPGLVAYITRRLTLGTWR